MANSSCYRRPLTSDEIYHHGILGQKWGVRRFQNPDGTLTSAGRQRYGKSTESIRKTVGNAKRKLQTEAVNTKNKIDNVKNSLSDKQKKAIKVGAAATATALAVVGTTYLVKSGKAEALMSAGKAAVKKAMSKTTHGKFMNMSEKELDSYIDRMGKVKKAIEFEDTVKHPLKGRAKKIAIKTIETAAAGAAAYGIGSLVDKRLDKNQLGDYMRRGGAKKK